MRSGGGGGGGHAIRAGGAAEADDSAMFRQATAAWESGAFESFLPKLKRALRTSRDYRLWHIHGLMLRRLDRREEALPSLRRAVELNPSAAGPAHALARTLYEAGLPSVDAFGAALRLAPGDPQILLDVASALIAEGDVASAGSGFERILASSQLWVEGHALLARLRWAQGEREGFTRSFDEAIARHPQSLELRRGQIIALIHAEQWDEALRRIQQGRAAIGDNVFFAANEAIVCAEMGDTERADALLAAFAELDDATVQVRRVRHLLRSGQPEQAAQVIDAWLYRPDGFMFWPYASVAWRMLGDPRWDWLEGDERFVGVYDIADRLPALDSLADKLRRLHTLSGQPLEQSLRGGTQTDGDIFMHVDPLLVRLREAIRRTVAQHVAKFPSHDERPPLLAPRRDSIRFEGAWSVRLNSRGFHANHVHPAGWISSALYIALPPVTGRDGAGVLALAEPRTPSVPVDLPPVITA